MLNRLAFGPDFSPFNILNISQVLSIFSERHLTFPLFRDSKGTITEENQESAKRLRQKWDAYAGPGPKWQDGRKRGLSQPIMPRDKKPVQARPDPIPTQQSPRSAKLAPRAPTLQDASPAQPFPIPSDASQQLCPESEH